MAMRVKAGTLQRSFRAFKVSSKPDDKGVFEGYASVFGVVDTYSETIVRGAFAESLAEHKANGTMPKMLWQHRWAEPIGVYLDMKEDDRGLFVRGQLLKDDVQQAKETYALLKAGALDGMSIGYVPMAWQKNAEDEDIIDLTKIDLWENSIVTFPANPEARVTDVRSLGGLPKTIREFEDFLRERGYSVNQARKIAECGFKVAQEGAGAPDMAELLSVIKRNTSILSRS